MLLLSKRKREPTVLSFDESERRALLHKEWTRYKTTQHRNEMTAVARVCRSQQRALEELRKESEELYQSAIQVRYKKTITVLFINTLLNTQKPSSRVTSDLYQQPAYLLCRNNVRP